MKLSNTAEHVHKLPPNADLQPQTHQRIQHRLEDAEGSSSMKGLQKWLMPPCPPPKILKSLRLEKEGYFFLHIQVAVNS